MNLSVHVLFGMVNNLMCEVLVPESLIGHKRIGVNRALRFDMSTDVSLNRVLFAVRKHHGANLPAALQNPHHGGLVFHSALRNHAFPPFGVHEASSSANESFVHFNVLSL